MHKNYFIKITTFPTSYNAASYEIHPTISKVFFQIVLTVEIVKMRGDFSSRKGAEERYVF